MSAIRPLIVLLAVVAPGAALAQEVATSSIALVSYAELKVDRDITAAGLGAALPLLVAVEARPTMRMTDVDLGAVSDLAASAACGWSASLVIASCSPGTGQGYIVKRGSDVEHWFANLRVRVRSYGDTATYDVQVSAPTGTGDGTLINSGFQDCAEKPHRPPPGASGASAPLAAFTVGNPSTQERCIGFANRFGTTGNQDFSRTVTFTIVSSS